MSMRLRVWVSTVLCLISAIAFTACGRGGSAPAASADLAPGASLGIHLELSAAHNLRDMGGYRTDDGHVVTRGLLYRSDVFNPLDEEDRAKLAPIGLVRDYDLRTDMEIERQPDQLPADAEHVQLNVLADENQAMTGDLASLANDPRRATAELGGGKLEALFADIYRKLIWLPSARHAYGELFRSLADRSNLPAVFHCTTGKDRTGWAAAALLTLLGVSREQVYTDYLRTNDYLLPYYAPQIDAFAKAGGDPSIPVTAFGVKHDYLDAAFEEMHERYGTIERYFSEGLGIDAQGQQQLRSAYLSAG